MKREGVREKGDKESEEKEGREKGKEDGREGEGDWKERKHRVRGGVGRRKGGREVSRKGGEKEGVRQEIR